MAIQILGSRGSFGHFCFSRCPLRRRKGFTIRTIPVWSVLIFREKTRDRNWFLREFPCTCFVRPSASLTRISSVRNWILKLNKHAESRSIRSITVTTNQRTSIDFDGRETSGEEMIHLNCFAAGFCFGLFESFKLKHQLIAAWIVQRWNSSTETAHIVSEDTRYSSQRDSYLETQKPGQEGNVSND